MGEGGCSVQGAETGEGAALVWVKQAGLSCQGGESNGKDPLKNVRDGFEKDDYAKEAGVS